MHALKSTCYLLLYIILNLYEVIFLMGLHVLVIIKLFQLHPLESPGMVCIVVVGYHGYCIIPYHFVNNSLTSLLSMVENVHCTG